MISARTKHVLLAALFHFVVLYLGLVAPFPTSPNVLSLSGTWADHLMQWDSEWLINIAHFGYTFPLSVQRSFVATGNTIPFYPPYRAAAFFPGLPIIIHVLTPIGTLVLINVLFLLSLWLLYGIVEREHPRLALEATVLFAINPCSIFFSSLYTETFTVLAVLLIMTGLQKGASRVGYALSLTGVGLATSVHDLGAFTIFFALRYLRLHQWTRFAGYVIVAILPPVLYETYLWSHFHTPFALLHAESSWSREWRFPFVNILDTILQRQFSLNALMVIVVTFLAIMHIARSFSRDAKWRVASPEQILFSRETALWMVSILLLGLCAYIPGYPLKSVLRFFCVLWPAYLVVPNLQSDPTKHRLPWSYLFVGGFAMYAAYGTMLFTHGWFFQ
ncbi:mannosyltransferase family protein [Alicyclobacillus dauci]|uniref:Mannosyltransferase (PIG-V) n=1 Tax=Alicyclobacillus dauci TaxID=1475485 RepID=A0ABY6Z6C1_9BACL|nr:mannosyltransferase family protein [Alicyclobacillus dauci]WAH38372.1 hypothetical protein NZD86_07810 [Alicyclobacillus dauci]